MIVTVADTGSGIPPDMLESVFGMFTQVDSVRDRAFGGLGIGLTLVRSMVELHGGTITAESTGPNQGSCRARRRRPPKRNPRRHPQRRPS